MWDQFHPPPRTNDGVGEQDADVEEDFKNHNISSTSTKDVVTAPVVRKVSSLISLGRSSWRSHDGSLWLFIP